MKEIKASTIKNGKTRTGSIIAQMATAEIVSSLGTRSVNELVLTIVPDTEKQKHFYMVIEDPEGFIRALKELVHPLTF